MSQWLRLSALGLAACGGLTPLGPYMSVDDTSIVDTVDTGDIDTDRDTSVGSGSDPVLQTLSAADMGTQISVAFTATDSDNDLNGGKFELTVNNGTTSYDIPGSLSTWDASAGSGTIRFAAPSTGGGAGCSGGSSTVSIRGVVQDAAGGRSAQKSTSISLSTGGGGVALTEIGDTLDDVVDGGTISVPCSFAGNIYQTGAGNGYWDLDIVAFAVNARGSGLGLTWTASGADYDVYLFDSTGYILLTLFDGDMTFAPPLASGINDGSTPENVTVTLTPGEVYYALVGGWDGPAGAYSLAVR